MADYPNQVTFRFVEVELLDDLRQLGFVEGDVMAAKTEHDRHQVMDICEDGNIDMVRRVMNRAFAECVELCYPYSKIPMSESDLTDIDDVLYNGSPNYGPLKPVTQYVMELNLPNEFSETTVKLIEAYIHEYLICSVMCYWMSIVKPEAEAHWKEKVEAAGQSIRSSLNSRCGRVRRPLTPFG